MIGGRRAADDSGVVDENVDATEVLDRFFNEARADRGIANVAGESDAIDPDFCDEFLGGFGCVNGAVDCNVGSCFGKRNGDARSEAARRPGNER